LGIGSSVILSTDDSPIIADAIANGMCFGDELAEVKWVRLLDFFA
jgi:hypothetical protein